MWQLRPSDAATTLSGWLAKETTLRRCWATLLAVLPPTNENLKNKCVSVEGMQCGVTQALVLDLMY